MSEPTPTVAPPEAGATAPARPSMGTRTRKKRGTSLFAHGEPMIWLTGGALVIALAMIVGLLLLVVERGLGTFWPKAVVQVRTLEGRTYLGEVSDRNRYDPGASAIEALPEALRDAAREKIAAAGGVAERIQYRTGNFDLTGTHFTWISDYEVAETSEPEWAVTVERLTWGRFYGVPKAFVVRETAEDGTTRERIEAEGPEAAWAAFEARHDEIRARWRERRGLEKHDIGRVNRRLDAARLGENRAALESPHTVEGYRRARRPVEAACAEERRALDERFAGVADPVQRLDDAERRLREARPADDPYRTFLERERDAARRALAAAEEETGRTAAAYREAVAANARACAEKLAAVDAAFPLISEAAAETRKVEAWAKDAGHEIRWRIDALRAANEPYVLRFDTANGRVADLLVEEIVRAYPANQLGLGAKFSTYFSRWGEFLTDEPREANSEGGVWPAIFGTVVMTLIMSILVVPFGVLAALYLREYAKAGPIVSTVRIAINNLAGVPSIVFGVFGLGFFCYVVGVRIDELIFPEYAPNPKYGKGGILWASVTLALLTLPVVIVATEEALAAVPGSMREGSYACGASKWQTIKRIVLPRAMPGIMTGMILAVARGAGEVAPLMLVGAVKLAPELPVDGVAPFVHPERSFMHLGFHIYDLGFQSQNSEAAKPMVFSTTLLLISIVVVLNAVGMIVRARLRRKFGVGA